MKNKIAYFFCKETAKGRLAEDADEDALSGESGIAYAVLWRFLSGERQLPLGNLVRLPKILNCRTYFLSFSRHYSARMAVLTGLRNL